MNPEEKPKIEQFNSDKIIHEWLSVARNRERLPTLVFKSNDAYNAVVQFASAIYDFTGEVADKVYFIGNVYIKIALQGAPKIITP